MEDEPGDVRFTLFNEMPDTVYANPQSVLTVKTARRKLRKNSAQLISSLNERQTVDHSSDVQVGSVAWDIVIASSLNLNETSPPNAQK